MNERIVTLLHKSIGDIPLDESEKKELDNWLAQSPYNRSLFEEIMNKEKLQEDVKEMLSYDIKDLWSKIEQRKEGKIVSIDSTKYKWWYAAAAVIFIMLTVGAYYIFITRVKQEMAATKPTEKRFKNDVAPGHDGAILKLADGRTIILDNAANGALTTEGNTKIEKTANGQLAYHATTGKQQMKVAYNTLSTPRGRKFQLTLPDGSNVWLNAESSITYPSAFIGAERKVEINGEAYFEVAKDASRPFRVSVAPSPSERAGGEVVEVLGTHFNIMAYNNENSIKTTLLEGSVKITKGNSSRLLTPGQQGQVSSGAEEIKVISDENLEEAIAWKNGLFIFEGADIKTIMRQVSRWYDLEINYEKEISQTFSGTIQRTVSASKLFNYLELTGHVHFRIEGKKVTVTE
jgi:ferric-dicitrate binding protein FerR (iron transport regulator)